MNRESLRRQPKFKDLDVDDKKDLCINIQSFEDPAYKTNYLELERAVQVRSACLAS